MITFRLDPSSGVPTYLQLVHQVQHALRAGHLRADAPGPPPKFNGARDNLYSAAGPDFAVSKV